MSELWEPTVIPEAHPKDEPMPSMWFVLTVPALIAIAAVVVEVF